MERRRLRSKEGGKVEDGVEAAREEEGQEKSGYGEELGEDSMGRNQGVDKVEGVSILALT